ncbi:lytic transglycosylase domain-containing protein [Sphingomonas sp.]|uniref:lytic transglycosylase domain-containing protein n=1 Tax=Sphingomonas sp. TaxID=28214 RepID=UPI0025FA0324|nr:lytic transglycosylase domain-containing protein [Sphingomonas sp.]
MVSTVSSAAQAARVHDAIATASTRTGVAFSYLYSQAKVESGLDPDARAGTSSATGLYQFVEQTWLGTVARHGAEHGLGAEAAAISRGRDGRYRVADAGARAAILALRRNPETSAAMAAEFASDNRASLERRLGHSVQSVDLYLAHFLGAAGAGRFLQAVETDPAASGAALFPAAARANRSVFYERSGAPRSLTEIRQRFATKFQPEAAPPGPQQWATASPARTINPINARLAYLMLASLGVRA